MFMLAIEIGGKSKQHHFPFLCSFKLFNEKLFRRSLVTS